MARTCTFAVLVLSAIAIAAATAADPPARTVPDKVILGYTFGACDENLTSVVRDGVNVLMWSFAVLGPGLDVVVPDVAGVNLTCVTRTAKALEDANLPTLHIIAIGGWNAPHPDTASGDGKAWFSAWDKWNKAIPGFAGFDGFDWDIEGNDDPASPYNNFTQAGLDLMGTMSQEAKAAGYLVTMAPPQSYLDVSESTFDTSLLHADPSFHPDFAYHGHNVYAYLLAKYGAETFDLVSIQLYETWSKANAQVYNNFVDPVEYLTEWAKAVTSGWTVEFSAVPALGLNDTKVVVDPSRLVVGVANAWAGKKTVNSRAVLFWPDELEKAWDALGDAKVQPRGFMYWSISSEGAVPAGATDPLFLARELNAFVQTRTMPTDGPSVTLPGGGVVVGKQLADSQQFLGIRYAAKPTGANRFRAAQPPPTLDAHSAPYDARGYGPPCIQVQDPNTLPGPEAPPMDEDCLFVNVWRPNKVATAAAATAPVLVWIHGGGFVLGAASSGWSNASQLASDPGGTVLVSLNYRLGPLGFLDVSGVKGAPVGMGTGGQNGVLDQIAALRWVQANIAAFGGDPARVTIFGESAGGVAVCLLTASPQATGLFQRAVIESGPCTVQGGDGWGPASAASGAARAASMLREVGSPADMEALRAVPAQQLVWDDAVNADPSFSGTFLDGFVMPRAPASYFAEGKINAQAVVLGSTSKDGTAAFYSTAPLFNSSGGGAGAYADAMRGRWGADAYEAVMVQYPLSRFNGSVPSAFLQADGDHTVLCPTREIAKALATRGTPVWHFVFAHWSVNFCDVALYPRGLNVTLNTTGDHFYDHGGWASHGADVPYVFGTTTGSDYWGNRTHCPFSEEHGEQALTDAMQAYWLSFAATGVPSAALAKWEPFTAQNGRTLQLSAGAQEGGGTRLQVDFKKDDCDFWLTMNITQRARVNSEL